MQSQLTQLQQLMLSQLTLLLQHQQLTLSQLTQHQQNNQLIIEKADLRVGFFMSIVFGATCSELHVSTRTPSLNKECSHFDSINYSFHPTSPQHLLRSVSGL